MELRHLRYFRAVAEELHFGRAAARLHIAQPPLSQQIRQLEQELGVALLTRSTRRVELTPAGTDYLARTVAILDAVDSAGRRAQQIAVGLRGRLTIGCVGSATYSLLPQFARTLREQLPDLDISIRGEMLAPAQLDALHNGDIDLALLRLPTDEPNLLVETIRTDRLILALPDDHRLTTAHRLHLQDLREEDFIAHAGSGQSAMHSILVSACTDAGFIPHIRHEVQETSTLTTLVAAGLGVALVPEPTSAIGISGVTYRPLTASITNIDLIAARRINDLSAPIAERALRVLRVVANPPS